VNLQDHGVILGCDWLAKHSPFIVDFQGSSFTILKYGVTPATFPICNSATKLTEIPVDQMHKLLQQGAVGYILQLNTILETPKDTQEILLALEQILQQYSEVFVEPRTLPPHRQCDYQIPLKDGVVPPMTRPYRVPHKQKDEMEAQITELLANKVIRTSQSPYASPTILVRKKDGSWRLCVDYRKLNALTIKNKFPILVLEDLLDELHGAKIFTKLDLKSGYHQICMNPADITKTTFRTYYGHYEYLVMSFGLSNAPGTFQALMNEIFSEYLRKFILVFFDDILIYNPDQKNTLQAPVNSLERITAKPTICKNEQMCVWGPSGRILRPCH
jgi:hypothetical protein